MTTDQSEVLIEIMREHADLVRRLTKSFDMIAEAMREQTEASKCLSDLVKAMSDKQDKNDARAWSWPF